MTPTWQHTPELDAALSELRNGRSHLFITGKAGTGKSTLLTHFREEQEQQVVVLAPTGVAALNVGGQTIHSFFAFSPNVTLDEARQSARRHKQKKLFLSLNELIIDEISMVRADLIDCMDVFLRQIRSTNQPFGGIRLIFFGDLYQLPPIVTSSERSEFSRLYQSPYFFGARVFQELLQDDMPPFKIIELHHIFRQSDDTFITILNNIRARTVTQEQLDILNQQVGVELAVPSIILTGRRDQAKYLNDQHIASLNTSTKNYTGSVSGKFPAGSLPTEQGLQLKVGARVMFIANDSSKRWVNGTLGTIEALQNDSAKVRTDDGKLYEVQPYLWELSHMRFDSEQERLNREVIGSFSQLPLIVAHAITIHKSQGKTFDYVTIDLERGAFAHGQTYVALSRCRTLEGMSLTAPIRQSHIMVDRGVATFLTQFFAQQSQELL